MRFGEIIISLGITAVILFVVLYLSKRTAPTTDYQTQHSDLIFTHSAFAVSRGVGTPARFDVSVAGGLLPDSSTLSLFVRQTNSLTDTLFKRAPLLTVPGEGLVYRRELLFPGVGKEFEYYFALSAPKDSAGADTTLARLPEEQSENPGTVLRVRFEGTAPRNLAVTYLVAMFGALFCLVLSMMFVQNYPKDPRAIVRASRSSLIGVIVLGVGVFLIGTKVEDVLYGTSWNGFPFGHEFGDTLALVLIVYWTVLVATYWKAVTGKVPTETTRADKTRLAFVIGALAVAAAFLIPHTVIKL